MTADGPAKGIPFLESAFADRYGSALLDAVRESAAHARSEGYYPALVLDNAMADETGTDGLLDCWRTWWLHQTDIGLVYRTYLECLAVRDGYAKVFDTMSEPMRVGSSLPALSPGGHDVLPAVVVTLNDKIPLREMVRSSQ